MPSHDLSGDVRPLVAVAPGEAGDLAEDLAALVRALAPFADAEDIDVVTSHAGGDARSQGEWLTVVWQGPSAGPFGPAMDDEEQGLGEELLDRFRAIRTLAQAELPIGDVMASLLAEAVAALRSVVDLHVQPVPAAMGTELLRERLYRAAIAALPSVLRRTDIDPARGSWPDIYRGALAVVCWRLREPLWLHPAAHVTAAARCLLRPDVLGEELATWQHRLITAAERALDGGAGAEDALALAEWLAACPPVRLRASAPAVRASAEPVGLAEPIQIRDESADRLWLVAPTRPLAAYMSAVLAGLDIWGNVPGRDGARRQPLPPGGAAQA